MAAVDPVNEGTEEVQSPDPKKVIASRVTGTVKWFNVKRGYGFVQRHDTKTDLFIHQSAIVKNNPQKSRKSVGEKEEILFDVVEGDKGDEAANVSGPDGTPVQGSQYAPDWRRRGGRGRGRGRARNTSGGNDSRGRGTPRGGGGYVRGPSGFGGRPRGGRFYSVEFRRPGPPMYDRPYEEPYYGQYDYMRGGAAFRGDRDRFYDNDYYSYRNGPGMPPMRGGRGGPMFMRGGRGGFDYEFRNGRGAGPRRGGRQPRNRTESGRSVESDGERGGRRRKRRSNRKSDGAPNKVEGEKPVTGASGVDCAQSNL